MVPNFWLPDPGKTIACGASPEPKSERKPFGEVHLVVFSPGRVDFWLEHACVVQKDPLVPHLMHNAIDLGFVFGIHVLDFPEGGRECELVSVPPDDVE